MLGNGDAKVLHEKVDMYSKRFMYEKTSLNTILDKIKLFCVVLGYRVLSHYSVLAN